MEEDVISIGINESRSWLMLEEERSQYGSGRVRSWGRKQIRTTTVIAVQMNAIISIESYAVAAIKVTMALPSAAMKVWI